jgi:hypothetical protein
LVFSFFGQESRTSNLEFYYFRSLVNLVLCTCSLNLEESNLNLGILKLLPQSEFHGPSTKLLEGGWERPELLVSCSCVHERVLLLLSASLH